MPRARPFRRAAAWLRPRGQFLLGHFGRGDRVVGKGGEAAVRRQQDAFRPEQLDCRFGALQDLFHGFHPVQFLIHRADADPPIRGQIPQYVQLARPRRTELQEVIADLQFAQRGNSGR